MSGISANERAYLDTIRMAEGTWHGGGTKGYGTMFGGGQFDWSKGHPDRVVRSGGYASAAAGAYQFMPDTWRQVSGQLGLKDFSPESQDRAALQLIRNRGVDPTQPMTADTLARLAPEWASLPAKSGKSYYNQPVKGRDELLGFYSQRLQGGGATGGGATGGGATSGETPSSPQPTAVQPLAVQPLAVQPLAVQPLAVQPLAVSPLETVSALAAGRETPSMLSAALGASDAMPSPATGRQGTPMAGSLSARLRQGLLAQLKSGAVESSIANGIGLAG